MLGYSVKAIDNKVTYDLLLNVHYAKRIPSISYAFGLFKDDLLVGVVTYGTPSSSTLRTGLAGKENADKVLELNRLCLVNNLKNEASYLVGQSLKMLPPAKYVVSYADASQGHVGYVYQATNFLYSGLSAKRTDYVVEGEEHLHNTTITDKYRGVPNRIALLREQYGDKLKVLPRPRKHRYITITGSKSVKKKLAKLIKYKLESYPK